jgi:hypothetical protein
MPNVRHIRVDPPRVVPRRGVRWLVVLGWSVLSLAVLMVAGCWMAMSHAGRSFDAAIARQRARGMRVTADDFPPPIIAAGQNAAEAYYEAFDRMCVPDKDLLDDYLSYADFRREQHPEIALLLTENQDALELLHDAGRRPAVDWGIRFAFPALDTLYPQLAELRKAAKLLAVAALSAKDRGDDLEYVRTVRSIMNLADRVMDDYGGVISQLVGTACAAIALDTIERSAPALGAAFASPGYSPEFEQAVRELIGALLDESVPRRAWKRAIDVDLFWILDGTSGAGIQAVLPPGTPAFQLSVARPFLRAYLDNDLAQATDEFYALSTLLDFERWPQATAAVPAPPTGLLRVLSSILVPSLERAADLAFRVIVLRRMSAVALALRLYELDHGSRPDSLDALVPYYLAAVPQDPYAVDPRPLSYLPNHVPPLLYSHGPDGDDDNGAYSLKPTGSVSMDLDDLVYFLDGVRPQASRKPREPADEDE